MSKTGTPTEKNKIISEHLPYEIDMLRHSYQRLESISHGQATLNVLLNAFCVHARNLLDFFWDKQHKNYAVARQFTRGSYNPFGGVSPKADGLYGKLNDQIVHLTYSRTDVTEDKLGDQARADLKDRIEKEIDRFSEHIDDLYRHLWNYRGEFPLNPPIIRQNSTATSNKVATFTIG